MNEVLLAFLTFCATFCAGVAVWLTLQLRKLRQLSAAMFVGFQEAKIIVDAYVAQGIGLCCDICGNQMSTTEQVHIVQQPDGTFIVAHPSHHVHERDLS